MRFNYLLLASAVVVAACQSPATQSTETSPNPAASKSATAGTAANRDFSISYEKYTLENGLEVILHEDHSDPVVAVATLLHVGSNREEPGKTGFAHFFEHMSFNDSENVPVGANRKLIPEWGGDRNGGTWSDGTIYYEVVPKDAFEKIMWIDSDRLGYMINTVTEAALEREKQVVKNEKRQRVDNAPYGFTDEVIRKALYPENHPYNWTVIGSLPDLQAATLEDVKEFYNKYYGASNATLVIAGDINVAETKKLVNQWFGEIRSGQAVPPLNPEPVKLQQVKSLYYEDNFAKLPELRRIYPTVKEYHPDTYALSILADLLSGSKKSPLYEVLVEDRKLAPQPRSYQSSSELAGEFIIRVRANAGTDLDSVQAAINRAFKNFEQTGFTDNELKRIKAEQETALYTGASTVLNKAFQLAQDNEFIGDPGFISKRARLMNAVSREDIMRVYNTYIKSKPYVLTSFVPKGSANLAVTGANLAEVYVEEIKDNIANEEVSQGEEASYTKTETKFDRSEPDFGPAPVFTMPDVYKAELPHGFKVLGIENNELPIVAFNITISGGHWLDPIEKSGTANLLTDLMMQGTAKRTPAELEEAIGLLGATISITTTEEEIIINAQCLARNFEETLALVQEILLEPRWDEGEFNRLKSAVLTQLKDREANPTSIASIRFSELLYGPDHILGVPTSGTLSSVKDITIEDVKAYYQNNLSPQLSTAHIAGAVPQERAKTAFAELAQNWPSKEVSNKEYGIVQNKTAGNIYFIDVPGSKQSVIYLGKLTQPATHPNFNNMQYANEVLGGGSSGKLTQTLRIEKGYTYGAYSFFRDYKEVSPFIAYTSVRANATVPSLEIIEEMIGNYSQDFNAEEVALTQNKILKANTKDFESLYEKLGLLRQISKFNKPTDYIRQGQQELIAMKADDFKQLISENLSERDMTYVIVGDAETQLEAIKAFRPGKVYQLNIDGEPVN
jgi:zinc protease